MPRVKQSKITARFKSFLAKEGDRRRQDQQTCTIFESTKARKTTEIAQGGNINAIERNKKTVALGKQRKWKELLNLYKNESNKFNNVNYATAMSKLQRIRSLDQRNPLFLKFVDNLAAKVKERGLEWIGMREISNIAHAIGKMRLRTTSARQIVEFASRTDIAKIMVEEGKPQAVANTA
jgi:hypothetical protein